MDASAPMPSYTRQFPVSRLSRVVSAVAGACLPGPERAPWRVRLVRRLGSPATKSLRLHSVDSDLKPSVPETGATSSAPPALLDAVAMGDSRAMKQCIEVHGPLVWGIVRRRVKDHFAAEDLVQEIFTEVWKSSGRHDPAIASEGGFISMIARRRAIDWLRRQQRLVPTGIQRDLIIREAQCARLGFGEMRQSNSGDTHHAEPLGGHDAAVACDQHTGAIHQDWIHKTEFGNRSRNLCHLRR